MSDHDEQQAGTEQSHETQSTNASEPQAQELSDEALENVAGGCQVGVTLAMPTVIGVPIVPFVDF